MGRKNLSETEISAILDQISPHQPLNGAERENFTALVQAIDAKPNHVPNAAAHLALHMGSIASDMLTIIERSPFLVGVSVNLANRIHDHYRVKARVTPETARLMLSGWRKEVEDLFRPRG